MTLVIDCDGVLTDGKLYMAASGEKLFKAFHSRDVRALREFVFRGFRVVIVTADDSSITKHFAEKCGVEVMVMRDKAKVVSLIGQIDMAVGDDAWDFPMLTAAKHRFAPKDAHKSIKELPFLQLLDKNAGEGVIAELLDHLIATNTLGTL